METTNLNKNLREIFQTKYIIPLYQRNFDWKDIEIAQLMQDLYESYKNGGNYFIGSLVVLKRSDGFFEVIDGQQRLTVLSLLLKIVEELDSPQLFYDSRPEVEAFFGSFYLNGKTDDVTYDYTVSHLINAVDYINQSNLAINKTSAEELTLLNMDDLEREEFSKFLMEKVILIKVEIPKDTDVAAYFEIMNNRGEQLQKHEILKSYFLETFKKETIINDELSVEYNTGAQNEFSKIWDACSQMDTHVQKLFKVDDRKKYFGEDFDNYPDEFTYDDEYKSIEGFSIDEILEEDYTNGQNIKGIDDVDDTGKDSSIIDFPNFLMHIFRLSYPSKVDDIENKIPLNEKDLISVYENIKTEIDSVTFIENLLYYRTVFDRFVVKASYNDNKEEKYDWTLKKPYKYKYEKKDTYSLKYRNSFGDQSKDISEEDSKNNYEQERLVKSLSLLQVTFRNRKYKNWLFDLLNFFSEKNNFSTNSQDYQFYIDQWMIKYFNAYKICERYDKGTNVPHFLFNFIDYLYWVESKGNYPFDFTYRNSVEHHLPVSLMEEKHQEFINNLGNLCLVSKSSNSKMNNAAPRIKADKDGVYYKSTLTPKRKRMYDITNDDEKWDILQIQKHQTEVEDLLNQRESVLAKLEPSE